MPKAPKWSAKFTEPIPTPGGKTLRTLKDARDYIVSRDDYREQHWQNAFERVSQTAGYQGNGAWMFLANAAVRSALLHDEPPEPRREKRRLRIGKRLDPKR